MTDEWRNRDIKEASDRVTLSHRTDPAPVMLTPPTSLVGNDDPSGGNLRPVLGVYRRQETMILVVVAIMSQCLLIA
jgi:hypothetical protein